MNKEQLEANLKKGYSLVSVTKSFNTHRDGTTKYKFISYTTKVIKQVNLRDIKDSNRNFSTDYEYKELYEYIEGAKILLHSKTSKGLKELIKETYPEEFI